MVVAGVGGWVVGIAAAALPQDLSVRTWEVLRPIPSQRYRPDDLCHVCSHRLLCLVNRPAFASTKMLFHWMSWLALASWMLLFSTWCHSSDEKGDFC